MKPPPSTLHHIVLLSWYHYWRKPIYELDTTGIQTQLLTFSLCLPSNFPTASAFAPWSDFSSSRSTAFRFLQRWKRELFHGKLRGIPHNAKPPRNKALSYRALFLGEGGIGGPLRFPWCFSHCPPRKMNIQMDGNGVMCTHFFLVKIWSVIQLKQPSWTPKKWMWRWKWLFFSYLG